MGIYIGSERLSSLYVGGSKVKEVWLGTDKVYGSAAEVWTLWDGGPVEGVEWLGNALTRSGYYGAMYADVNSATLHSYTYTASASYAQNAHFVLSDELVIPTSATKMNVLVYCRSDGYGFNDDYSVKLGVIAKDATAASSFVSLGTGSCSGTAYSSLSKAKTITASVSAYAGVSGYKPMLYFSQHPNASYQRGIYIAKIWYT